MSTTKTKASAANNDNPLRKRAQQLGLWGLLSHWEEVAGKPWLPKVLEYEATARSQRSLERRVKNAKLGRFKPLVDFDWKWPKEIDRELIDEVFQLDFVGESANVIIVGPNGVGKTMIAKNLVHRAILRGYTARVTTASELLNDLAAQDSGSALMRRFRRYSNPDILLVDEVGYLSTSTEHADLLFEIVNRRYQERSIILTTNKPFTEWNEVFPSSGCLVTLIDRLVHKSEIIKIDGKSYRLKEAQERARDRERRSKEKKKTKKR